MPPLGPRVVLLALPLARWGMFMLPSPTPDCLHVAYTRPRPYVFTRPRDWSTMSLTALLIFRPSGLQASGFDVWVAD